MSTDSVLTPADILIQSVMKTIGKREFLKTVERLFPTKVAKERKAYSRRPLASEEEQCSATTACSARSRRFRSRSPPAVSA